MPEPIEFPRPALSASSRGRWNWKKPEFAWPLALVAGFGGASLGLLIGVPGLASLLAFLAWAPFHVRLAASGARWLVALTSIAWAVAFVGAISGAAIEVSAESVSGRLLFADPETLAFFDLDGGGRALRLAWTLAAILLLVCLARFFRGVFLLLFVAFALGAVAGAAGGAAVQLAEEARALGATPSTIGVLIGGWPPALPLTLVGLLIAAAPIACPGRLLPFSEVDSGRRRQIELGLFVVGLALFAEPLYGPLLTSALAAH